MLDAFRITSMIPGLPERIYSAWLDSGAHAAFTGAAAKIDPRIGGKFSVLGGSVSGRTVGLLPGRRIVQTWRAKEFPGGSSDSRLEIQFERADGATRITIMHSALPAGQGEQLKQTWIVRYFQPLRAYFAGLVLGRPPSRKADPAPGAPSPALPLAKRPLKSTAARKAEPTKPAGKARGSSKPRKSASKAAARRPAKRKGRR